jgi:hypothetical protein
MGRFWAMVCIGRSLGRPSVVSSLVGRKEPIRQAAEGKRHKNNDAGIRSQWNGGSAETAWANYIRWLETDTEFLLYTSPACFNILPKRALRPEQLAEIRDRLAKKISSPNLR